MKLRDQILGLSLLISAGNLFGQSNQARLFLPFLDKESQSNVVVTYNMSGTEAPCPLEFTNVLSNTNLFTFEEQKTIQEIFTKYKDVTTNTGPAGTELIGLYKTNFFVKILNREEPIEQWVANFGYVNSKSREEIHFGGHGVLFARFRSESGDGYDAGFSSAADGPILSFSEFKKGFPNGILAGFSNPHQSWTNDYRHAEFAGCPVVVYRQITNGLILGKYLMWNHENNHLILEAEFKEPYDFEKHRTDQQMFDGH